MWRWSLVLVWSLTTGCAEEAKPERREQLTQTERNIVEWEKAQPRPSQAMVERIENLVAQEPCVGTLNRWSRHYSYLYDPVREELHPRIIVLHLEEAGKFGIRAGLQISAPEIVFRNHDLEVRMARGDFDRLDGRIRFSFCGNNFNNGENIPSSDFENVDAYYRELKKRRAVISAWTAVYAPLALQR